jgi:hypothetical protein
MGEDKKDEAPTRKCEQCGADMQFIAKMPRAGGLPPVNIFRCRPCTNVVTEPVT